jgi:hypothetical protein
MRKDFVGWMKCYRNPTDLGNLGNVWFQDVSPNLQAYEQAYE